MEHRNEIVSYIGALSEILWFILTFHKYTFREVLTYFVCITQLWMVMYAPVHYFKIASETTYRDVTTFLCSYLGKGVIINRYLYCLNLREKCVVITLILALDMVKYFK